MRQIICQPSSVSAISSQSGITSVLRIRSEIVFVDTNIDQDCKKKTHPNTVWSIQIELIQIFYLRTDEIFGSSRMMVPTSKLRRRWRASTTISTNQLVGFGMDRLILVFVFILKRQWSFFSNLILRRISKLGHIKRLYMFLDFWILIQ